ncbi:MAG TPA: tetratricopeptide repeat-containing protein kinase family protein, partial [Vicinamibacterales bacterium]|nr:tetratricopeptide repeat-containing protein kinase family protein [Vicinamibacterales bacterium]
EQGVVKLLDFGISKPLADLSVTREADRRFTPAYASPEQLKGETITAATDVYALGLLLYELLAGGLPHGLGSMEGFTRRLDDAPFAPPSSAEGLPRGYRNAIRGDLDRIVLHALERRPEQRYPSIEQLLRDLDAYRDGFPISVETPSVVDRVWKFVRRHSVAVPAAAAAIASLAIVTGVAISQADQSARDQQIAEKRFQDLRTFSHSVIYELHDEIRSVPGTVSARRSLVTMAVRYLDGLNSEKIADDSLQQELAGAYVRMGYIQGGYMGVNLGDTPGSMRSYRTALSIYDGLWRRYQASVDIAAARFGAVYHLSLMINDPGEALRFLAPYTREADAWMTTNTAGQALFASDLLHAATGRVLRNLGALDLALREFDLSADRQRRSLPLVDGRTEMGPMFGTSVNAGQTFFQMCLTEFARAEALLQMGRTEEALEALKASRAALDRSTGVRNSPSNHRMAARVRGLTARTLLRLGRIDEAESESVAEQLQAHINVADGSATAQRDLAEAQWHAGSVYQARQNHVAAVAEFFKASETIRASVDRDISFLQLRLLGAVILNDYGRALLQAGQTANAETALRRAAEFAAQGIGETPDWVQWWRERARAQSALGLSRALSDSDRIALLRGAAADWNELARRSPLNREYHTERTAVIRAGQ